MKTRKISKVVKTSRPLTTRQGFHSDVLRWYGLYKGELNASCKSGEISIHTMNSYLWTICKLCDFSDSYIDGYKTMRDIDSELINEYLYWLKSYTYNMNKGDIDYQQILLKEFSVFMDTIEDNIVTYTDFLDTKDDFLSKRESDLHIDSRPRFKRH